MRRLICLASMFLATALLSSCGTRLNLDNPDTQLNVGVGMARSDLWREAAFRFERAVELSPADAMARNNLAVAYEGMGEFDKAREQYTEALRLDRGNQYIQRNYSRFVEFYQRNKSGQATTETGSTAGGKKTEDTEPAPPVAVSPPDEGPQIPPAVAQPEPPSPPVSTPPDTGAADPNPGVSR